jgi:arginyl-tRNA synthetase
MENLGKSVFARYMQIIDPNYPFPEDGYVGDYIKQIAQSIKSIRNEQDSLRRTQLTSLSSKSG